MYWIVAISSAGIITLAHHLGFVKKAYAVAGSIAKCPMCSAFWGTLAVLLLMECRLLEAVALSFIVAYVSNWFGLLLGVLNRVYDKIWQKVNRKKE